MSYSKLSWAQNDQHQFEKQISDQHKSSRIKTNTKNAIYKYWTVKTQANTSEGHSMKSLPCEIFKKQDYTLKKKIINTYLLRAFCVWSFLLEDSMDDKNLQSAEHYLPVDGQVHPLL